MKVNELQKNLQASVGRVLRYAEQEYGREVIDGMTPSDGAKMVDLSIGYTPVVIDRWTEQHWDIPEPVKVITDGKAFAAVWACRQLNGDIGPRNFRNMDDIEHLICRARYLLLRGMFYKMFGSYSYPEQRKIIAWYFDGVMWRPTPESEIGKMMKLV